MLYTVGCSPSPNKDDHNMGEEDEVNDEESLKMIDYLLSDNEIECRSVDSFSPNVHSKV